MTLTNQDIADLVAFRHELHRFPEISGEEAETAQRVVAFLDDTRPDKVLTGLGGHGVAAVYDSGVPGPTLLFRSETDALPIEEISDAPHRSTVPGKSHMCGHDGHSAILAALGRQFGRQRPARGRVRDAELCPLSGDEPGHGYRPIASATQRATLRLSTSHRIRSSAFSRRSRANSARSSSDNPPAPFSRRHRSRFTQLARVRR